MAVGKERIDKIDRYACDAACSVNTSTASRLPFFAGVALLTWIALGFAELAAAASVTYAGIAFAGSERGQKQRFPFSTNLKSALDGQLRNIVPTIRPANYTLTMEKKNSLGDADQAISVALVITNETVSAENLGPFYKLFTFVRAQALFYDLKTMSVVRAYPLGFVFLDTLKQAPTDQQKQDAVQIVFSGKDDKPGLIQQFESAILNGALPNNESKTVGVANVTLGEEVKQFFPGGYDENESAIWLADQLAESLSSKIGIPVLPFKMGYATGQFEMSINENVFNLNIPEPDYAIDIEVPRMRIVTFDVKPAGRSLIYASYVNITVNRPLGGDPYLSAPFKNGVTKLVPASQIQTDDFPAYQESIVGLFRQFADAIEGARTPWLKASTDAPNIDKQLTATRAVLDKCK